MKKKKSADTTQHRAEADDSGGLKAFKLESSHATPSIRSLKHYIVENASLLNRGAKLAILNLVMMEASSTVTEVGAAKEVNINLDLLAEINEDILGHIYNIVRMRRQALCHPAGVLTRPPLDRLTEYSGE